MIIPIPPNLNATSAEKTKSCIQKFLLLRDLHFCFSLKERNELLPIQPTSVVVPSNGVSFPKTSNSEGEVQVIPCSIMQTEVEGGKKIQVKVPTLLFIFADKIVITKEEVAISAQPIQHINTSTRQNLLYLDCKQDWKPNNFERCLIFPEESSAQKAQQFIDEKRKLFISAKIEQLEKLLQ